MSEEFEPKIHQSESNFGHELMAKAEELFKKDAQNGVAKYGFLEKDWKLLTKDLQQFGFKKFLDESIGKAILLISPQKLKIIDIERYGNFLIPPIILLPKRKVITNEKGEIINPVIKELGNTNGLELVLATETIPKKENIICQYQRLVLIVNAYNNYFFLKENLFITGKQRQEGINKLEINIMKRPELKEIRLFQKILKKNLEKI